MAIYDYTGLTKEGRKTKGFVDAESDRAARQKLKGQGIFPTTVKLSKAREPSKAGGSRFNIQIQRQSVSTAQLSIATRQLATLVGAGMPLVESLKALSEQIDNLTLKTVIAEVSDAVNEGSTLAEALRNYPRVFPGLYPNMIASGEASGTLDLVLDRLADLLEAQTSLQRKIMGAMAYPILMLFLCCGVVMLLLAYVVPQLVTIFEEQQATLPLPTQIVIVLSDFVKTYWLLIVVFIPACFFGLRFYIASKKGRLQYDSLKLKLPLIGPITIKIATARFARTLGTMLASGVELLTALSIVRNIISNVVIQDLLDTASEGVREGKSLAKELERTKLFPRLLVHMVATGEKTGQLESMLLRSAKAYESELDALVAGLTAIINPILILFLAAIVGLILIAVMLPMLEMTSLIA